MALSSKLKVFRTPIGFHDAYIAAPSKKAALEAWGSDKDLFSSGAAERVDDPDLMREPLAHPGTVVRRLRGTYDEHMAALPKDRPPPREIAAKREPAKESKPTRNAKVVAKPPRRPKPKPRPDRTPLATAETALADAQTRYDAERAALAQRQAQLDRERRRLEVNQAREREGLERKVDAAREKYDAALRAWRAD